MQKGHKIASVGYELNRQVRRWFAVGAAFNVVVCVALLTSGYYAGRESPVFAAAISFPVVFAFNAMLGVRQFFKFPRITVLPDGLDIGARFVPYAAISNIKVHEGWGSLFPMATITYTYHGVNMNALFGCSPLSVSLLARLMAELSEKAGLQAAGLVKEPGPEQP